MCGESSAKQGPAAGVPHAIRGMSDAIPRPRTSGLDAADPARPRAHVRGADGGPRFAEGFLRARRRRLRAAPAEPRDREERCPTNLLGISHGPLLPAPRWLRGRAARLILSWC